MAPGTIRRAAVLAAQAADLRCLLARATDFYHIDISPATTRACYGKNREILGAYLPVTGYSWRLEETDGEIDADGHR